MKKIAMLAVLLAVSFVMKAQGYKPLEKVEIGDYPTTQVRFEEREYLYGGTYYVAYHMLGMRTLKAELGVPPLLELTYTEDYDIKVGMTGVFSIGGEDYYLPVSFVGEGTLNKHIIYFDLLKEHIRHISVSGIQKIKYLHNGKNIHNVEFNLIEQELWRRTAEELIKGVAKFNIL
jgi:hypothetical protein